MHPIGKGSCRRVWIVLITATFSGCDAPDRPNDLTGESGRIEAATITFPGEETAQGVAQQVPAFAGFSLDSGTLKVYLTDLSKADAVKLILAPIIAVDPQLSRASWDFVEVRYSLAELTAARSILFHALSIPGTVSVGISVRNNAVRVGVQDEHAAAAVRDFMAREGVDQRMTILKITKPFTVEQSIDAYTRPLAAGVAIDRAGSTGACTLGPMVKKGSDRTTVYGLVASHCTSVIGGVGGNTNFYQVDTTNFSHYIGYETWDRQFDYVPCPAGKLCRRSDAALVRLQSNTYYYFSVIANVGWPDPDSSSLSRNTSWDIWIDQQYGIPFVQPFVGMSVSKVGRRTGWTYGEVTETCQAVGITATHVIICASFADYGSAGGDSGSAVWRNADPLWPNNTDYVLLYGMHFAGDGTTAAFADWDALEYDMNGDLHIK